MFSKTTSWKFLLRMEVLWKRTDWLRAVILLRLTDEWIAVKSSPSLSSQNVFGAGHKAQLISLLPPAVLAPSLTLPAYWGEKTDHPRENPSLLEANSEMKHKYCVY